MNVCSEQDFQASPGSPLALTEPWKPSDSVPLTPDLLLSPTITLPSASPAASVQQHQEFSAAVVGVKRRIKGIMSIKESIRDETQKFGEKIRCQDNVFMCNECDFKCPEVAEYIARKHASRNNCLFKSSKFKKIGISKKCYECDFTTQLNKEFHAHTKIHMEKKHVCSICRKSFLERKLYRQHVKDHVKAFMCDKCNCSFARNEELKRHISFKHKVKFERETLQEKLSKARSTEVMGMIEETRNMYTKMLNEFRVRTVNEQFSEFEERNGNFKRALELLKETVPKASAQFKCNRCGKKFSNKYNLARHQKLSCICKT